jgi:hypothetical protein
MVVEFLDILGACNVMEELLQLVDDNYKDEDFEYELIFR